MKSQFGQDRWVLAVLDGLRGGYFLDSGAGNGVDGSNTYALETEYGWTGVCAEPHRPDFEALHRARPGSACVPVALWNTEGEMAFVPAGGLSGLAVAFHPDHRARAELEFGRVEPVTVRTVSSRTLLSDAGAPRVIDYWSLDVEGAELTVLMDFPWSEYRVRCLTVEHNHLPDRGRIYELMRGLGYVRAAELGVDDCYLLRSPSCV
jgi:FkbM family methyltransferase